MRRVIVGLVFCVSLLGMCGLVNAEDFSLDFTGAMNQLNTSFVSKNASITTVKWLIQTYCDVVFDSPWFTDSAFTYSAKQSVFVYFLCNNVGKSSPAELLPQNLFDRSSRWELGLQDIRYLVDGGNTKTDFCSLDKNLSQCNLSKYVPKLFNMIINDYVNLKQPSLFGFLPGTDDVQAANTFSAAYFNGLEICDDSDDRDYSDTCKTLKKHINDAQKTFADVQIFDTEELKKLSDLKHVCEPANENYNLFLCWLYGDTQYSLERFLNLSYNELFYYRLFAQYYAWMITTKPDILHIKLKEVNAEIFTRTTNMTNELIWSQEALSMSIRMLRDFYTAFPLHIGFLMYQEDLKNLAKPLGQLYTPWSQLYYTLKNVQKKE